MQKIVVSFFSQKQKKIGLSDFAFQVADEKLCIRLQPTSSNLFNKPNIPLEHTSMVPLHSKMRLEFLHFFSTVRWGVQQLCSKGIHPQSLTWNLQCTCLLFKRKKTSKRPTSFLWQFQFFFHFRGCIFRKISWIPGFLRGKKTKIDHTNSQMEPVDLPPPPAAELAPAPFRGRLSRTKTVAGSDWGKIRSRFFPQKHLGDVDFLQNMSFWPKSSLSNSLNLKILLGSFLEGNMPVGKKHHQFRDSPVQTKTESFHTQGYPPLIVSKVFWGADTNGPDVSELPIFRWVMKTVKW